MFARLSGWKTIDLVDPVQELGPEFFAQLFQHARLDHLLALAALGQLHG